MKGLLCAQCIDFRALSVGGPVECRCGNVQAWWVDPRKGIAMFWARNRAAAFGLGVHNHYLQSAIGVEGGPQPKTNDEWRALHDQATASPGYIFDASNRACWALIFTPGATSDTSFSEERHG